MQTTAADMSMLMEMIYQCAAGGGTLLAAYPEHVTPDECQTMLEIMNENRIGSLIEAGVPEGTSVAHKHGWTAETHGDSGIVFWPQRGLRPGGIHAHPRLAGMADQLPSDGGYLAGDL